MWPVIAHFFRAYRPKNVAKILFHPPNCTFFSKFTIKTSKFAKTNATRVSGQGIFTPKEIRWAFFSSFKKVEIGANLSGLVGRS